MSTISKLDPNVRADRAWRMHILRRLHRTIALLHKQGDVKQSLMLGMIVTLLQRVHDLSWLPGNVKQSVFLKHLPAEILA